MKVLVLGGSGYAGPVFCQYFKDKGLEVTNYDRLMYGGEADIVGDIRDENTLIPAIYKADAVVNLAGMSLDLKEDLKPSFTWESNYIANKAIADLLRHTGKRIVFASSISVYGLQDERCDETSLIKPGSLYAQTKALSEGLFLSPGINSVILRLSTMYGMSPNPRLDTITNHMIADSYFKKKISVQGSKRYRSIINVKDAAKGFYLALTTPYPREVYNLGTNDQNKRIGEIGEVIAEKTGVEMTVDDTGIDNRSYVIDFTKIKGGLGFTANYTVDHAIAEYYDAFNDGTIKDPEDERYYHFKYLKNHGSF